MLVSLLNVLRNSVTGVDVGETKLGGEKPCEGEALVLNIFTEKVSDRSEELEHGETALAVVLEVSGECLTQESILNTETEFLVGWKARLEELLEIRVNVSVVNLL